MQYTPSVNQSQQERLERSLGVWRGHPRCDVVEVDPLTLEAFSPSHALLCDAASLMAQTESFMILGWIVKPKHE
eukprot:838495-Amphidinium_carterae.2